MADICQVVKGDKEAQKNLPKVMQDALKKGNKTPTPKGARSYSTMTTQSSQGMNMGLVDFEAASKLPATPGLKFEAPTLPLPQDGHLKHRYDPVVEQVTNLLMRHGKKSVAQRVRHFLRVVFKSTALTMPRSKWQ